MQGMMGGSMNPQEMMQKMMGDNSPKDRMENMMEMMPQCINMMFSQLEPQDRAEFARAMLNRMHEELKKYADGPSPASDTPPSGKKPEDSGQTGPETEGKKGWNKNK